MSEGPFDIVLLVRDSRTHEVLTDLQAYAVPPTTLNTILNAAQDKVAHLAADKESE